MCEPLGVTATSVQPQRLRPGLHLVRRDAEHVQLGLDAPYAVVLPYHPEVHHLVRCLAAGRSPGRLGEIGSRAWAAIARADLLVTEPQARTETAGLRLALEVPEGAEQILAPLLEACGLRAGRRTTRPDVALVMAPGEVDRERVDAWMQDDVPHLVVRDHGSVVVLGPFVVPGKTACLRCVDAHAAVADPRRGLILAQTIAERPLVPMPTDPALRAMALAAAARELFSFAQGRRPATWSATLEIRPDLSDTPRLWTRHPGCGCAWGGALTG
jgi:hypothetical protein